MSEADVSLEGLFEELLGQSAEVRASYYQAHDVPEAVAALAEELFVAHVTADFELPEAPSLVDLGTSAEFAGVGLILDGRYRLDAVLGGGSFGTVYRGVDQLTDESVAVKVPRVAPLSRAALEREAACLRRLEHGVARLRDQGVFVHESVGEYHYLVFDLIDGSPFPGHGCPVRAFSSLVRSVAAVHSRGVVHRDLKPENVLVNADQMAFLVDFGIAHGPAFGAERAGRDLSVGTEAYAAPEQLDGEMGDAGSDVYSCALMGLRALTGMSALELRSASAAPPLDPVNELLCLRLLRIVSGPRGQRPRHAQELEANLELPDSAQGAQPLDLPSGAGAELESLVESALSQRSADGATPWEWLFTGIEPILHLRSGSARELARRCGTNRGAATRELREWIERGVAFWSDDRIELHASGLAALRSEPVGTVPAGAEKAEADASVELDAAAKSAWVHGVVAEVRSLDDGGWREQASSVLVRSLARVRTWPLGSASAERRLLPMLVRLAMEDGKLLALDRAAFELARSRSHGVFRECLDHGVQVARSSALGDNLRAARGVEAVVSPVDVASQDDGHGSQNEWDRITAHALSIHYHGSLSLERAKGRAVRRAVVLRAREVAGDRRQGGALRAARFRWLALRAYSRGCFDRSARLYRASARATESKYTVASCLLSAASAAMEAWAFAAALADVERARDAIEALPFPELEARTIWTMRTLRFRMGELPAPDAELDAGYEALNSVRLSALHGLTEAAIARVRGDEARYRAMAELSFRSFETLGQPESTALARALMIDAGGEAWDGDADLFGSLTAGSDPGVALQVLALAPAARVICEPLVAGWLKSYEPGPPGRRLDVLDAHEIETWLELTPFWDGQAPIP